LEGLPETGNELAAEDAAKHVDGKKESLAGSNPVGVIERQAACGNDAMDMRMKPELLAPGV
jgi:hypothetical protein